MLKIKRLNCNKIAIAILSTFLAYQAQAEEFNFDANGSNYNTQSVQAQNDLSYDQSLATNVPPAAQITKLPVVPSNVRSNASKTAFNSAVQKTTGLTPDMIKELKRNYEEKDRAINESTGSYEPIAKSRTIPVELGVSSKKEVIRTAANFSTSITVVDSTGKPWNVVNTTVGNSNVFDLMRLDGPEGNLFSLSATKNNSRSNLILVLKEGQGNGIKVPIVLDLVSGQREVDDKIVIRVQGIGPNGSIEQVNLTQGIDSKYNAWLDGVLPSNVTKLKSNDKFVKAWKDIDGSIVVISKYKIYSPNSTVMLDSSDGDATLYKLSAKSSVLRGIDPSTKEQKTIRITGF